MKRNSKKSGGFTLIEIILSIAIIAILSISVYDGYLILINKTKGGQVKQTSTLIGKQISEKIKSTIDSKDVTINQEKGSTILRLTDQMNFIKNGESYAYTMYFDEAGKIMGSEDGCRYEAKIDLNPKTATSDEDHTSTTVSIDEILSNTNKDIDIYNVYVIGQNGQAKVVDIKPTTSQYITANMTADIEIKNPADSKITIGSTSLDYNFNKHKIQINIDLKYCTGSVTINVNNETKTPLNLFVLNNKDAQVVNSKGILNQYYRSDAESKIGILYDVNIEINDKNTSTSDNYNPIFKTSFVQNINTKDNIK